MTKPNIECVSAYVVPQTGWNQDGDAFHDLFDWQPLHVQVAVQNTGDGDAEAFRVRLLIDDREHEDAKTHALPAGAEQWIEWYHDPIAGGTHTLKVICDYRGTVRESDERDNTFTQEFVVHAGEARAISFADEAYEIEAEPRPLAELVTIQRGTHGNLLVQLDQDLDATSVGRFLFAGGAPAGVDVEIDMDASARYSVTGVTRAMLDLMYPDVASLAGHVLGQEWEAAAQRPLASVVSVERVDAGRTALIILDRELDRESTIRYLFASGAPDVEIELDMGAPNRWEVKNLSSAALAAMFDDVADHVRRAPVVVDPASGTDTTQAWVQLKKNTIGVADDRLEAMNGVIYQAVDQWSDAAETKIGGLKGPSESGLGVGLFNVLSEVVSAVLINANPAVTIAVETTKAFAQAFASGMKDAAEASTEDRYDDAKHQLDQIVDRLKTATASSAKAAWKDSAKLIDDDLDRLFAAFPEYASLPFSDDLTTEKWLADQIGIPDVHDLDPTQAITEKLWAEFNPDYERITAKLRFHDMSHNDKIQLLRGMSKQERKEYLEHIGESPELWEDAILPVGGHGRV